jgi:hypothetical protein
VNYAGVELRRRWIVRGEVPANQKILEILYHFWKYVKYVQCELFENLENLGYIW